MIDNTEKLLAEMPGEPIKHHAATLQKGLPDDGTNRTLVKHWLEGAFIDKLGNVWIEESTLESVLGHTGFAQLSRARRESDPHFITLPTDNKSYFRGSLVIDLIQTVIAEADNPNVVERANSSLQLYLSIVESEPFRKITNSGEADRFREDLFQLRNLANQQISNREAGDNRNPATGRGIDLLRIATLHLGESLHRLHLTHRRYHLLRLVEKEPRQLSQLAEALGLSSAGVTNEVDALGKLNYVTREELTVTLTDLGHGVVEQLQSETASWISETLSASDKTTKDEHTLTGKLIEKW